MNFNINWPWPFPWHPFKPPTPTPTPSPIPSSFAQQLLDAHNTIRLQHGLNKLNSNSELLVCATEHSQDESIHHFMSHTGSDFSSPFDRMRKAGYNYGVAGENIAPPDYKDVPSVMTAWMNSLAHRANILRSGFVDFGADCIDGYWVCDFGAPLQEGRALGHFFPGPLT